MLAGWAAKIAIATTIVGAAAGVAVVEPWIESTPTPTGSHVRSTGTVRRTSERIPVVRVTSEEDVPSVAREVVVARTERSIAVEAPNHRPHREQGAAAAVSSETIAPSVVVPRAASEGVLVLGEEVELLRRAQIALRAGDGETALTLAEEHAARFPQGSLSSERSVLRVLSLCALGRSEGPVLARQLLTDPATSAARARICAACGFSDPE